MTEKGMNRSEASFEEAKALLDSILEGLDKPQREALLQLLLSLTA